LKAVRVREFQCELRLPLPPEKVFPFFADAFNLEAITPPWLNFHVLTPRPLEMREGTLIDYRLRVHGLPVRWRTRISAWQPPHRFTDEQLRGPYRQWIHEHTFEPCAGGTLCRDVVKYAVPFDFLVHGLFVRRDVEQIFEYRRQALLKHFAAA
jgi:ligand-binding SRPBCC domain-containing protein